MLCLDLLKFCFKLLCIFVLGKFSFVEIIAIQGGVFLGCGIKLLLFITSNLSLSSVLSKY